MCRPYGACARGEHGPTASAVGYGLSSLTGLAREYMFLGWQFEMWNLRFQMSEGFACMRISAIVSSASL
jgi:hypothetical protein